MATGYSVSGRGDLDSLFMPRTSSAIANTGFKSNGSVDLAQRFEPRASTTAIVNTGYKSGSSDLATLFKDINAVTFTPIITLTMTAANYGGHVGYRNSASGYAAAGSMSGTPEWTKSAVLYRLEEFYYDTSINNEMFVRVSQASATPPNTDLCWLAMATTGTYVVGGTGRRVMTRAANYFSNTGTTPNSRPMRTWQINLAGINLVAGNSYTFEIG